MQPTCNDLYGNAWLAIQHQSRPDLSGEMDRSVKPFVYRSAFNVVSGGGGDLHPWRGDGLPWTAEESDVHIGVTAGGRLSDSNCVREPRPGVSTLFAPASMADYPSDVRNGVTAGGWLSNANGMCEPPCTNTLLAAAPVGNTPPESAVARSLAVLGGGGGRRVADDPINGEKRPASAAAEVAPDTDTTLPPGYPPPEKGNRAKPQVVNIRTNLKSKQKPGGYNAFCLFRSHLKHCMINRENMPLDEYLRHRRGLPESKFASLKRKSVNKDGWLAKRLKGKSKKDTNKFFAEMWRYLGEANPEKKKLYKQKAMEIKQELAQRELARDSASKS
jgi:hypothetical protein